MKTLLHLSKYYYPVLGGIENTAKQLVDGLSEYENVVICFSSDSNNYTDTIDNVKIYRVAVQYSLASQDIAFGYGKIVRDVIDKYRPDYIHVHCPNPFIYPYILRYAPSTTKILLHWHSDILGKGFLYLVIKPLETRLLKRANCILATSPNYAENSEAIAPYRSKIKVLQSAIRSHHLELTPDVENRMKEIKRNYLGKKIIFIFGRHVPYKGIDLLIASEKYIKSDVVVLIGGSGPITAKLKELAKGRDRIHFLGRLSDEDLTAHLWAADVLGFASNTKAEAFGLALAEGMFCKCVPITFAIPGSGVNWVSLKDETGLEVELGNVEKYAESIDKVLSDDNLRSTLSEAARQRVLQMFTVEKMIAKAKEIYKEL